MTRSIKRHKTFDRKYKTFTFNVEDNTRSHKNNTYANIPGEQELDGAIFPHPEQ